jgi:hypothetical protein
MPRSSKLHTLTHSKAKQAQSNIKQVPPGPANTKQVSPAPSEPSVPQTGSSSGSGFVNSMVSGFGWGIGTSLARKIFEPKITPEPQVQVPVQSDILTSNDIFKKYQECLERNESNTNCEMLLNIKS